MYDLADARYDVHRPPGASPVKRSYVLCSNPRSGSTLLAEALAATGNLGTPLEYFDGTGVMAQLVARWGCEHLSCYIDCLHRHRASAEGVLGAKVHWYQLQEMALTIACRPLAGRYGYQRAVLDAALPSARYVYVVREDLDRQAVSWARAKASQQWYLGDPRAVSEEPPYDFDHIEECRRDLEQAEAGWTGLFAAAGVEPLTVTYERLASQYAETVSAVSRYLGVDLAVDDVPDPRLRKQSNDRSERMLGRYLEERGRRR